MFYIVPEAVRLLLSQSTFTWLTFGL